MGNVLSWTNIVCVATALLLVSARTPAQTPADAASCAQGQGDTRIAACTRLIRAGKLNRQNLAAVYFDRAIAERQQNASEAIADYGEAIALRPDLAPAYAARGALLRERGDVRKALDDFNADLRLRPDDLETLLDRGAAREGLSDPDGAISDYSAVLRLKPNDERALLDRGISRGETRDFAGALSDFNAAVALSPGSSEGYSGRCWIRAVSGDAPESAIEDCNRAVGARPDNAAALGYRAMLSLRLSDFDAAIKDYDAALARKPDDATFLFGRGIAKLRAGNQTGANEDLLAARKLNPRIAQVYAGYGIAP